MKFNKKITVTALSTVLGLGLVGSISGAVAWYQYSTRATSSIVGTSAGNGGTLQIKRVGVDGAEWKRDLVTSDATAGTTFDGKYQPITFGNMGANDPLPVLNNAPAAYKSPKYGEADMANWTKAEKNKDYLQYTVELQALELNGQDYQRVQKKVYLTDIVLQDAAIGTAQPTFNKITEAIRVHISVEESERASEQDQGKRNFLLAYKDLTGTNALPTHGYLDLDGDNKKDVVGGYQWDDGREDLIDYGDGAIDQQSSLKTGKQEAIQASSLDADGEGHTGSIDNNDTIIAYTPATAQGTTKITITIWNEGWAQLDPYDDQQNQDADVKSMWSPERNGIEFNVGLTFDVGSQAFDAQN